MREPEQTLTTSLALRVAQWFALAVALLLFAQWPLRELAGVGALLANDIAQMLFALYVSLAVAHASRRDAHVAAHPQALSRGGSSSRWRQIGAALAPLPWCLWLLVTSALPVWRSVVGLESFPESYNPGYFVVKVALIVLGASLSIQCLRALHALRRAP